MNFKHLFIDHESFSAADLKKQGSYAYAEHPTTEIMLTTYAFDDGPVYCYDATDGGPMPRDLRRALRMFAKGYTGDDGPRMVGANYLMFDRLLLRECWGYDITPRNIIDTMVLAFRHALPGSLAAQCEVLGVSEDLAKDKAGKALIQRFCKPTPKNYKVRRYDHTTHPQEWRQFVAYAKSDITAMREVFYRIPQWGNSRFEDEVLAVDQLINDRGFYVDTALAEAAIAAVKKHKAELQAEAAEKWGAGLTGAAFIPLLQDLAPAFDIPNAQKSTLNDLLADEDLPDDARTLIEMRLGASSTASTKYNPLLLGLSRDGRRRGCIQYGGANRTLRFAGKGFQPQNLARGYYTVDELAIAIPVMLKGRAHWLYDVSKLTASTVRGCIVPTPGNKLVVADYSNVEGRGLAWLAGEGSALATFRAGLDIYCVTAGKMFGLDPAYIKEHRKDLRQIGKTCLRHNTQVLTSSGFKDIVEVCETDKVWSGEKWVNTSGAKFMGWKPVIALDGVQMTDDHRILSNSWKEAKLLVSNKSMLLRALEIGSDAWLSFVNCQGGTGTANFLSSAIADRCRGASCSTTSGTGGPHNATHVLKKQQSGIEKSISATKTSCVTVPTGLGCSIDYRRRSAGATTRKTEHTQTMGAVASLCLMAGAPINGRSYCTSRPWRVGMTPSWKWTEKIMTVDTSLGISDSSAARKTATIDDRCPPCSASLMPRYAVLRNLNGSWKLCEPVYDLINVEEGNRFLIKSDSGFLIAHNCELALGYSGGVGAFVNMAKVTGLDLFAMAEMMKGTFPDHIWAAARKGYEYARIQEKNKRGFAGKKAERPSYDLPRNVWMTCDAIKRMWRESHPATVRFWRELEDGVMAAIKNPGKSYWAGAHVRPALDPSGRFAFDEEKAIKITRTFTRDDEGKKVPGWWLKLELPSGRILSYPGIGISVEKIAEDEDVERPEYRERARYMGQNQTTRQWQKIYSYSGKWCENLCQALCRDLLAFALVGVERAGWPIVLHVHDEIVTDVPNAPKYSAAELERLMCELPDWAEGFPLAAEGQELFRYAK